MKTSIHIPSITAFASVAILSFCPGISLAVESEKPSEEVGKMPSTEQMKMADQRFLMESYSGELLHVMASKYALEQVTSPQVRELAEMLIAHHEKGLKTLETLATNEGVVLPKDLLPPQRAMLDAAMTIKGELFVTTYLINMTTLHVHDVLQYSNTAAKSKNAKITTYAYETLPMLKAHLKTIKAMAAAEVELKEDI